MVKKEEGVQKTIKIRSRLSWVADSAERTASVPFPPHLTFISSVMEPTETRSISDVDKKVGNLRRNKISVVGQGGVDVEMHDYMPSSTVIKVRKKGN